MIHFPNDILSKLQTYQTLLLKWQKSVNLVSNSTIADSWNRHFIDSAQLAKYITKPNPRVVDIGSGGGFPGLVLAMMLDGEFHLVESDKKKCIFLSEVSRETGTNIIIHNDRIETVSISDIDYITSRACANVSQIFNLSEKLVSRGTEYLLLKGKTHRIEIDEAKKEWQFEVEIFPSITENDSALLSVSKIQRRNQ